MTLDQLIQGEQGRLALIGLHEAPPETATAFATYRHPLAVTIVAGERYRLAPCPTCGSDWIPWSFVYTWHHRGPLQRDCWRFSDSRHFANDWDTFERLSRGWLQPAPTQFGIASIAAA